ncbi:MAG: DNA methylase [Clostridia bacterium]|nr:DNA methylase [Clostridia bacterium]
MATQRTYLAIDLKSFYASVECVERGLDPMTTNLVVADESRTEKTICLAISPSLKAYGVSSRARLFEVVQRVEEVNRERRMRAPGHTFRDKSYRDLLVRNDPSVELGYITAVPRMSLYVQYSSRIYEVYLKYIAPEDIHIYSIDEVFLDVTHYLATYRCTPRELAMRIILDVLEQTGVTATAGIGTNMYLCKIAMDIVAKHIPADKNGVRIAELDEQSYRRTLWSHTPITDFWRVGGGTARRLAEYGMYTMGDVARCSVGKADDFCNEALLYRLFGINAELLIDHAWGWEPCTIADVKAYRPQTNSLCSGQVLHRPYTTDEAALVVREMADQLALDLVEKALVTDLLTLTIGYDIQSADNYAGTITVDRYGRKTPKHAHGTAHTPRKTSASSLITQAIMELYTRIVDPHLLVRRITLTADRLQSEQQARQEAQCEQLDLFTDYARKDAEDARTEEALQKEQRAQKAMLAIRKKYGNNAILKGMSFKEGATAIDRGGQIGGHKA